MEERRPTYFGADEHWAEVGGAPLRYLRAGAGPPVVLIHGLIACSHVWRLTLQDLAGDHTVYVPDLPGFGRSGPLWGEPPTMAAMAARLLQFFDVCRLERPAVVGNSYGGALAMVLAAQTPERVRSLVLAAPANPFCEQSAALVRFYLSPPGRLLARLLPWLPHRLHVAGAARSFADPARMPEGAVEGYVEALRVPGGIPYTLSILRHWRPDMDRLGPLLPRLAALPVTFVWGDRDRAVSPASLERLRTVLPHARSVLLRNVGHLPMEEHPAEFNRIVRESLLQVEQLRRTPHGAA